MKIKTILALLVSIALIAILLTQIQIDELIYAFISINPLYVFIGFILYACSYVFRALRFKVLLNNRIKFKDLFSIVCVHNLINNMLPARTGELSYIYLVSSRNVSTGEGIATLTIARAFDFITISLLFFISAMLVEELPATISNAFLAIAIFLIIVLLFLAISAYKGKEFMDKVEIIAKKLNIKRFRIISFLIEKSNETAGSFNVIQSKKVIFYSFLFSIFIWISQYYVAYILLKAMDVDLDMTLVVLGSTFSLFANILPTPSIGAFGVYESGWAIAFISLGISKEIAVKSAFITHITTFFYFLILGVYGLSLIKLHKIKG